MYNARKLNRARHSLIMNMSITVHEAKFLTEIAMEAALANTIISV